MDKNELRKHAGLPLLTEGVKDQADAEKKVVALMKKLEAREEQAYNAYLEIVAERSVWGNLAVTGGDGTIDSEWIDGVNAVKNLANLIADSKQSAKRIGFQDLVGSSFEELERDLNRKVDKVKGKL
jgi:hypothetical protein